MLSFRQYLNEVQRSPERAKKLNDYLAKRFKGDENEQRFRSPNYMSHYSPEKHDAHMFDYHGVQDVKIHDLHPGQ